LLTCRRLTVRGNAVHVVEIFLPLACPNGDLVPAAIFELIETELAQKFGGVTEYARGSARGSGRSTIK
jgi:hypothetical protein